MMLGPIRKGDFNPADLAAMIYKLNSDMFVFSGIDSTRMRSLTVINK